MKLPQIVLSLLVFSNFSSINAEKIENRIGKEEIKKYGITAESALNENLNSEWIQITIEKKEFHHIHEIFISKQETNGLVWIPINFLETKDKIEIRNLALPKDSIEQYKVHIRDDLASGTFVFHEHTFSILEAIESNKAGIETSGSSASRRSIP